MDNQIVAQLGADLIEATARNGASIISDKIRTAKTNKEYNCLLYTSDAADD